MRLLRASSLPYKGSEAFSGLLHEASFELSEHLSMHSALPAKRMEISFQREVTPRSLGLVGDQAKRVRFPDG